MKATVGGTATYYVGSLYELTGSTITKYYFAGAQRVAMRSGSTLTYLLGDHLGSTSLSVNTNGALVAELRYKPWGETRYTSGTMATDYQFTSQRNEASLGLYFYNARWYDGAIGRFAQADSIISDGVQGLDRYSYVNNSPMMYTDPSGNKCVGGECEKPKVIAALYVNLSTSLMSTGLGAQYTYRPGIIPAGHYNLCGDIALEMVYETATGKVNALDHIYLGSAGTTRESGDGTNAYELGQQFAGSFPNGWQATAYYLNYVVTFAAGNKNRLSYSDDARSLTQYGMNEVIDTLSGMLSSNHYVIVGVSQNTETGILDPGGVGHWVTVTKITDGYIFINNPFTNTRQKYTWDDFYKSFQNWILEIKPPKRVNSQFENKYGP